MVADVHTHRVPGHEGIEGNEEADRLAKEGTALDPPPDCQPTFAGALGVVRARTRDQFKTWWETEVATQERYKMLGLTTASLCCPKELELPRPILHRLLACRTGHGDFDRYHRIYNHDNPRNCTCGGIKTTEHLFFAVRLRNTEHSGQSSNLSHRHSRNTVTSNGQPKGLCRFPGDDKLL